MKLLLLLSNSLESYQSHMKLIKDSESKSIHIGKSKQYSGSLKP